jgi:hypothetical protein
MISSSNRIRAGIANAGSPVSLLTRLSNNQSVGYADHNVGFSISQYVVDCSDIPIQAFSRRSILPTGNLATLCREAAHPDA